MVKKVIYVRHYSSEESHPSELNYESEIKKFKVYIDALMRSYQDFTEDQAYLEYRNYISSQNVYSIRIIKDDKGHD